MKATCILLLATVSLLAGGCGKFLAIELSPQLIESKSVLASEQSAQSAVDGIFTNMRALTPTFLNGSVTIYAGLAADELRPSAQNATYLAFYENALLPDNSAVSGQLWAPGYNNLYRCNTLIDGLRESKALQSDARNRLLGELLVVRALHLYYLAGLFGDVPLVLSPDYAVNATLARTAYQDVMAQVVIDLEEARTLLPPRPVAPVKTRPTYWAATALLARVNLYLGNYAAAAQYADETIDNGPFDLPRDLGSVFGIDGPESIWEIAPPNGTGNTAEGNAFLPTSASTLSPVLLTPKLITAFEPGDLRLTNWMGVSEGQEERVYYAAKYKYRQSGTTVEHPIMLRLAEQYLIQAEVRFISGDEPGARAALNAIRSRADIGLLDTTVTGDLLWQAIVLERRRELFAEWGHRWFDLRRWHIIDEVMAAAKPHWKPYMGFLPIPEAQLRYNYRLTQNPGY